MEFKHWPKIPRIQNEVWTVTEKIDGTNAVIAIDESKNIFAGSRNKWLNLDNDNHGFCRWVYYNKYELIKCLGIGYHYGEWYGQGIQRGYGLKEKRFALFYLAKDAVKPDCCGVVPTLNIFELGEGVHGLASAISMSRSLLTQIGSILVPGYTNPEGFIVRSTLTGQRYKYILE